MYLVSGPSEEDVCQCESILNVPVNIWPQTFIRDIYLSLPYPLLPKMPFSCLRGFPISPPQCLGTFKPAFNYLSFHWENSQSSFMPPWTPALRLQQSQFSSQRQIQDQFCFRKKTLHLSGIWEKSCFRVSESFIGARSCEKLTWEKHSWMENTRVFWVMKRDCFHWKHVTLHTESFPQSEASLHLSHISS